MAGRAWTDSSPAPTPEDTTQPTETLDEPLIPREPESLAVDQPGAEPTPATEPTPTEPTDWKSKLSDDEREKARLEILAATDPKEYAKVAGDRFNGYIGQRLQEERPKLAAELEAQRGELEILRARHAALENRDPDAALGVLQQMKDREASIQSTVAVQDAHAKFNASVDLFKQLDADPITRPLIVPLSEKAYGTDPVVAQRAFEADLSKSVVDGLPELIKRIEARTEAALRPAIEKELRAKLDREEPEVDRSSGRAAPMSNNTTWLNEFNEGLHNNPADYKRAMQLIAAL